MPFDTLKTHQFKSNFQQILGVEPWTPIFLGGIPFSQTPWCVTALVLLNL